jgi:hypothetical protein
MRKAKYFVLFLILLVFQVSCSSVSSIFSVIAVSQPTQIDPTETLPYLTNTPVISTPTSVVELTSTPVTEITGPEEIVITIEPTLSTHTRVLEKGFAQVTPVDQWLAKSWNITKTSIVVQPNPASIDVPAFVSSVTTGQTGSLVGVSVPGIFQFNVIQQPGGDSSYISTESDIVTQYMAPLQSGVTGLIAHNTSQYAGGSFSLVAPGHEVVLVYGDGTTKTFVVAHTMEFIAKEPYSEYSNFVYYKGTSRDNRYAINSELSYSQLYNWVYTGNHVTLQTCIEGQMPDGTWNASWGRLFILAYPKE